MAIIKCPECRKRISSQALCCPRCGFPLDQSKRKPMETKDKVIGEDADNKYDVKKVTNCYEFKNHNYTNPGKSKPGSIFQPIYMDGVSTFIGISVDQEKTTTALLINKKIILFDKMFPTLYRIDYNSQELILKDIKSMYENTYSVKLFGAVICVPNYYSVRDRLNLIRSGKKAGYDIIRTTNNGSGVQSQLLEITRQNQLATSQTFFEVEKDCDSPKMVKIKQSDLFFDPFQYSSGIHCPNFQEVPQF